MPGVETRESPLEEHVATVDIRQRLIRLVTGILGGEPFPGHPFPVNRQLSDLGLSSLKMVNLMLAVEVEFDLAIPPGDITPEYFHCVASIEHMIERLRESA
jgi:acyl carrier protein